MYPNPTSGLVSVRCDADDYWFKLFDVNSKLIPEQHVEGIDTSLDISEYDAGVYFIKIKSGARYSPKS